ncbi:class II lanthipeptide, LchA2/BrtA2 family [Virgibacillus sp. YIM 98842]|uniref:class II lanthipeptide, LchA2/BrtA2 family n=1 Tax=Virgibacillus sp. YIM 98842 TaxID=2663533 RepID=UPI0013DB3D5A|nr:class II lanthipeptide, LchA2/BrtA2 family [Virgibacillus sp. YIM 98842]
MSKNEIRRNLVENSLTNAGSVNEDELKQLAGGEDATPDTHPTTIIPVSLAVCPTTTCRSFSSPCPN